MLFTFIIEHKLSPQVLSALAEVVTALTTLNLTGVRIMNNLTDLESKITALETKVTETVDTLKGLAKEVVDLKASGDVQAGIDALAARAQNVLDSLTTAEDAADDQLPVAPPTP